MKRLVAGLVFLAAAAQGSPLPAMGQASVSAVFAGLKDCGLHVVDAYDPRLPRPRTPADLAVVNASGRVLAYYLNYFGFGASHEFKNPDGGQVHSVRYGREGLAYTTPFRGVVAHANRFVTVAGPGYQGYCFSRPVPPAAFESCVAANWVNVITAQLCRFAP